MITCSQCGNESEDTAKFCSECGVTLNTFKNALLEKEKQINRIKSFIFIMVALLSISLVITVTSSCF